MANIDITPRASGSLLSILAAPFVAIGTAMVRISEANSQLKRAQFLQSLSDEELASRGLTRDEIVRHVFAGHIGF
ncbi:DUF1127 domain-containing protein [Cognatishimia sp.]|uniref:DUF1127 domain-containing protein n=1 Tax=Cognatishimia sp. TaxID=2211648 RepID=UPI003516CCD8